MRALAAATALALWIGAGWSVASASPLDASQRAVRGSCVESYTEVFRAARDVTFSGDYARLEVSAAVTRNPETDAVTDAKITVTSAQNLDAATQANLVAAMRAAYLRPDTSECAGVMSTRAHWVLRFGEKERLAAPDDPLNINRATAAAPLRRQPGMVELVDPATAVSRLTRQPIASESTTQRCFASELWRESGPLAPRDLMAPGARYRLQFFVTPQGLTERVDITTLDGQPVPDGALRTALEDYVRLSRFYPPVTEACQTRNAVGSLFVGRG